MFDSIIVEYPLQSLPQRLIDQWNGEVVFQTKDTPDQYMSLYKIDADGKLWYEERETEWVDPVDPESEVFSERIGHLKTISTTWKQIYFHGAISFYESYNHKNYKSEYSMSDNKEWQRYESGWVEYKALFKDGQMIAIDLVKDEKPQELTDEELEAKREKWAAQRAEMKAVFSKTRREHPTPEQKLIDQIYNATTEAAKFELHEREWHLKEILRLIKEYREKTDIWHTEDEQTNNGAESKDQLN
jgi:hypothetical protein